jgi:predicted MFS family arabinose efflux permease
MPARWLILLVLFVARTALAYQFQTIGAVGPVLIETFGIDFTWLGTLIGLYLLPGAVVAIPSGMIGQRFGAKRVVLAGLLLMALGGALTGSDSLALVFIGRLVSGIGGVLLNVMMTKMVTDWFAGREIVVAMSIFVASWPLGLALGLVSFPSVLGAWSWHGVMWLAALVSLAAFGLVAWCYDDPPDALPPSREPFRIALDGRESWLIAIAGTIWGVYNVGYIVLISFLPGLFTARGYTLAEASHVVSLLGWALIVSVPLAGFIAQRAERPNLQMMTGFVVVAAAAALLPFTSALLTTFGAIALLAGLPAGLIMALPSQALAPQHRAVGMGVFYTFYYACMAILPAVAGRVRDLSGSPAAPSLFAGAMMLLALLGLILFRIGQRSPKPSGQP